MGEGGGWDLGGGRPAPPRIKRLLGGKKFIVIVYIRPGQGRGGDEYYAVFFNCFLCSTLRHIFILSSNKHAQLFTEMPTASEAEAAASCSLLVV